MVDYKKDSSNGPNNNHLIAQPVPCYNSRRVVVILHVNHPITTVTITIINKLEDISQLKLPRFYPCYLMGKVYTVTVTRYQCKCTESGSICRLKRAYSINYEEMLAIYILLQQTLICYHLPKLFRLVSHHTADCLPATKLPAI